MTFRDRRPGSFSCPFSNFYFLVGRVAPGGAWLDDGVGSFNRVNLAAVERPRLGKRSRAMLIIGCDFHTRYQQIAMAREGTAELLLERRLDHESGEAHAFYRSLQSSHEPVRVGIEPTGPIHWFERLLAELGHELWIGDSARIRASERRKQKTEERAATRI